MTTPTPPTMQDLLAKYVHDVVLSEAQRLEEDCRFALLSMDPEYWDRLEIIVFPMDSGMARVVACRLDRSAS